MQHNLPQHRRGDQLQPLRALFVRRPPAVEQAVFIGVDQHQTQVQIWIVQIHFNFIQFGNSIVKCSCFGGLSLRGKFPCFFIDPVEPFGMYNRINDRDRIIL